MGATEDVKKSVLSPTHSHCYTRVNLSSMANKEVKIFGKGRHLIEDFTSTFLRAMLKGPFLLYLRGVRGVCCVNGARGVWCVV